MATAGIGVSSSLQKAYTAGVQCYTAFHLACTSLFIFVWEVCVAPKNAPFELPVTNPATKTTTVYHGRVDLGKDAQHKDVQLSYQAVGRIPMAPQGGGPSVPLWQLLSGTKEMKLRDVTKFGKLVSYGKHFYVADQLAHNKVPLEQAERHVVDWRDVHASNITEGTYAATNPGRRYMLQAHDEWLKVREVQACGRFDAIKWPAVVWLF